MIYELFLPLVFLNILGLGLFLTHGHYDSFWIILVSIGALLFAKGTFSKYSYQKSLRFSFLVWLCTSLCFFSFLSVINPQLIYAEVGSGLFDYLRAGIFITLVLSALYGIVVFKNFKDKDVHKRGLYLTTLAISLIVLQFINKILVIFVSPNPIIDTFSNCSEAAAAFLGGTNPYTLTFTDIYHGGYNYAPKLVYPPGLLYWFTPFWAIFRDIRTAYIAADIGIVILLLKTVRKLKVSKDVGYLFPLLWLAFPVSYFFLEQAWTDGYLAFLSIAVIYSTVSRNWIATGLLCGILVASKQYGLIVPACTVLFIFRHDGFRTAARVCALAFSTALLMIAPFLFSDAKALIDRTLVVFVELEMRRDSFSLVAWMVNEFDILPPGVLSLGIVLITFIATQFFIFKNAERKVQHLVGAIASTYLAFFLTGKIAFCNYYYMVSALVLLLVLLQLGETKEQKLR